MVEIRFAKDTDAGKILDIYAPYITFTTVTFECSVPTIFEMQRRINTISQKYPYLVCETDGVIAGYAYASEFFKRQAFSWDAELSVYINKDYFRHNVASALYYAVIELLKLQNYRNVYAKIAVPNEGSEGFHKAFGFSLAGKLSNTGYKLGTWIDLAIYEKHLTENFSAPPELVPISEIKCKKYKKIFESAQKILKI